MSVAEATPPDWHVLAAAEAAERLEVDPTVGLSSAEVVERTARYGPNRLAETPPRPRWKLFLDQFRSGIVVLLAGAAVLAAVFGDLKDPIVIAVVLLINAVLGYTQEAKASNALAALEEMLISRVRVRRDGEVREVVTDDLVPGDVVLLEAGDRVPADGRILMAANLSVDESALTGESVAVEKDGSVAPGPEVPLGDRVGSLYMNTTVTRGRSEMVVTATAMDTEMGKVADLLNAAEVGDTPLQRQLDGLTKRLAAIALVAVGLVFALQMIQGETFGDAALGAVALAVAAIPEGLPAVVTVTLAVGISQMAKRNAIVKRLHSVETLGSTTTICSDKTGTLTLNQMTAREVVRGGRSWAATGEGYRLEGGFEDPDGSTADPAELTETLVPAALCADAVVRTDGDGEPEVVGDPTEVALVVVAAKAGIDVDALREARPRLGEVPFDSATKFMATFHRAEDDDDAVVVYVKGAPDVVLERSTAFLDGDGSVRELDDESRSARHADNGRIASEGRRVLAVASRRLAASEVLGPDGQVADPDRWIDELVLHALVGIVDPPRSEARDAIRLCHRAGIDVKMITGDHASTAGAIAADLGIEGRVVTGDDLTAMSDDELAQAIEGIGVCARVSPEHKVRVVKALQARGHVVAMTGDGVNDAAALRTADIGVAMGITGTEVTKEAGDMVLTDDNFATIVGAVERGRTIYDNIVKFVRFQLSTNLGAIGTILTASLIGLPVPFTPIQVLWVNIIADGPPAMSLGVDPPAPGVMDRHPRRSDAPILSLSRVVRLLFFAAVMTVGTLGLFVWAREAYGEAVALTMTFNTFVLFQMVNAFNARTEHRSALTRYAFSNPKLWAAIGGVVALQVMATEWDPVQRLFDTETLSVAQWGLCIVVALTVLVAEELRKLVARWIGR
ncbi:cation-translocating P-type ATPase [Rhabdothermincola salaria]|uniref:cation-translocating P-type ATPase n=1 Tax=Rhabdothermincola salaria TaxID=2903142 RepID=UPI001E4FC70F|nr:HAD-IC family P-type ATPase [Rhabdothermincola salaria]